MSPGGWRLFAGAVTFVLWLGRMLAYLFVVVAVGCVLLAIWKIGVFYHLVYQLEN